MKFLARIFERLFLGMISLAVVIAIPTLIFDPLEDHLPLAVALILTYIIAAYILLPRVIRFSVMILRKGRVPRWVKTRDGLTADPVNIILVGTEEQLKKAFQKAGWYEADPLNLTTSWKITQTIARNKPYLTAPFSTRFLFGRKQDLGFQKNIGKSPLHRHHVRFWAANLNPSIDFTDIHYWTKKHDLNPTEPLMWVGSGTKDVGVGLARFTYQITHSVEKNVDIERDYILTSLRQAGCVVKEERHDAGEFVSKMYVSDGHIVVAHLSG